MLYSSIRNPMLIDSSFIVISPSSPTKSPIIDDNNHKLEWSSSGTQRRVSNVFNESSLVLNQTYGLKEDAAERKQRRLFFSSIRRRRKRRLFFDNDGHQETFETSRNHLPLPPKYSHNKAERSKIKWTDRWTRVRMLCRIATAFRTTHHTPAPRRKSNSLSSSREMPFHEHDLYYAHRPAANGKGSNSNNNKPKLRRVSSLTKMHEVESAGGGGGFMDTLKASDLLPRPNPEATKQLFEALAHEHKLKMKLKEARKAGSDAKSNQLAFEFLMNSSRGRSWFLSFLKSEYADENLLFWNACQKYRSAAESYFDSVNGVENEHPPDPEQHNDSGISIDQLQLTETSPIPTSDCSFYDNVHLVTTTTTTTPNRLSPKPSPPRQPIPPGDTAFEVSRLHNADESGNHFNLDISEKNISKTIGDDAELAQNWVNSNSNTALYEDKVDEVDGREPEFYHRVHRMAVEIWETYVRINSTLEVNLSSEMKHSIEAAVTGPVSISKSTELSSVNRKNGLIDPPSATVSSGILNKEIICPNQNSNEKSRRLLLKPNLFVSAQRHVYEMLEREPFKRFLHSDFVNKLMENVGSFDEK